ncbi:unnamed protein product [Kluyveromyces dobzhanskii CBS 2104]|uniref:DNA 3'-5' helicase n=1 Tax=Kluyveromyces dobzhanskii CBS 2104 TaxID=1427455 RepID=A0A0A8LD27_9SACH|nr:unnamed protein product [Kluyveromyces dobzhanskii CBS 2104]
MEELINGLNDRQRQAVTHREDDVLQVLAGPGTGKTKVLTARFAYLVIVKKIHPLRIIMTTFTRKAANEIKERLKPLLLQAGISSNGLLIGTFHSICVRLLRQAGHLINIPKNWSIARNEDINIILKALLEEAPVDIFVSSEFCTELGDTKKNTSFLRKKISDLKAQGLTPDSYQKDSTHDSAILFFYEHLQKALLSEALLDFDDILLYSKALLTQQRVWSFVRHVLVDEYQDTNDLQLDLIYLLARGKRDTCSGITVVGDADQSIYGFRFVSSDNFNKLIERCPVECAQISLVDNYRSAQTLLDFSEKVITQQKKNRIKRDPLKAQFNHNIKPFYSYIQRSDAFENTEASSVAHEILYLKSLPNLFAYSDVAILLRTRRQAYDLEKAFIKNCIPYRIVNAKGIWEKKESGIFLDYLRIISQESCVLAILRCLEFSSKGIGATTIKKIRSFFDKNPNTNSLDVLKLLCKSNDPKIEKISEALRNFVNGIERLRLQCKRCQSYEGLKDIFVDVYVFGKLHSVLRISDETIQEQLKENSLQKFIESEHPTMFKVLEMFTEYRLSKNDEDMIIEENDNDSTELTVIREGLSDCNPDFFEVITFFTKSISLYSGEDEKTGENSTQLINEHRERVTLSTIHAAKGLEWPVVFIPSIQQGLIPFTDKSAQQRLEDLAEVRRGNKDDDEFGSSSIDANDSLYTNKQFKEKELDIMDDLETVLNEERRIFFVALTRAKNLLYLSSSGKKSIFLENCEHLYSNNVLFNNPQSIAKFYRYMNKTLNETTSKFSLSSLCQDYQKYKTSKASSFIWNGNCVQLHSKFDFTNNTAAICSPELSSSFESAGSLLKTSQSFTKNNHNSKNINVLKRNYRPAPSGTIGGSKVTIKPRKRITIDILSKKPVKSTLSKPPKEVQSDIFLEQDLPNHLRSTGKINRITNSVADQKKSFAPAYTPVRNNSKRLSRPSDRNARSTISK